ncbi:hypothetical protein C8J57DRAFT_688557 [Mycena rebaudengoi]|nr:hypothetical protein C8J57DRAFT_688557 [Mycena rebaudengoi]
MPFFFSFYMIFLLLVLLSKFTNDSVIYTCLIPLPSCNIWYQKRAFSLAGRIGPAADLSCQLLLQVIGRLSVPLVSNSKLIRAFITCIPGSRPVTVCLWRRACR